MRRETNRTNPISLRSNTITSSEPGSLDNFGDVMGEVKNIILLIYKKFDFNQFEQVFGDILKLFNGHYPGYRRCNTFYHDLSHTMDCLLVTAKLIHGAGLNGIVFTPRDVTLGLISALMHDTGYIQAVEDNTGTGAKYTVSHIERSIEFMKKYLHDNAFPSEYLPICRNFLRCTGLDVKIAEIKFQSRQHEILGQILGTADLIGQMANENYLEKLPFLYDEFKEAGVPGYNDILDLLKKTPAFWEMVKQRLVNELGHVDRYLRDYLRALWGINQDLYRQAIDRNIERLQLFLAAPRPTFHGVRQAHIKWV
ncbi:MAG: hypothetical protein Q7O12_10725 [Deltaproteobacteria bacterium]|nr:hypothetical protein [Deltaproteobacteria bacterium]